MRQPYASLIVTGVKGIENRGWRTAYRGELWIHAGQRVDTAAMARYGHLLADREVPRSAILGSVDLLDCRQGFESEWADPGGDIWHWVLASPRPLATPIPATGRLGLWMVPPDLARLCP